MDKKQKLWIYFYYSGDLAEDVAKTVKAPDGALIQPKVLDEWERLPHVALANASVLEKQKLNLGVPSEQKQGGHTQAQVFIDGQAMLQLAWRGDLKMLRELDKSVQNAHFEASSSIDGKATGMATPDLWVYTCLKFMKDRSEGRTRICGYPNCVTPYFVSGRLDQQYCKHSCAVKHNHLRRAQAAESKSGRGNP
jgi:hypothetical protein